MSNYTWDVARLRMSALGSGMLGAPCTSTAVVAAVSAYKPFIDARNDAQGGEGAWGPPV
jgi:hypothetical protein